MHVVEYGFGAYELCGFYGRASHGVKSGPHRHLGKSGRKLCKCLNPRRDSQLLSEIALQYIDLATAQRPLFVHLVEDLRGLFSQVGKKAHRCNLWRWFPRRRCSLAVLRADHVFCTCCRFVGIQRMRSFMAMEGSRTTSHTGRIPPLNELVALKQKYGGLLIVDEILSLRSRALHRFWVPRGRDHWFPGACTLKPESRQPSIFVVAPRRVGHTGTTEGARWASCPCPATSLRPPGGGSQALAQPGREGGSSAATRDDGCPGDDAAWLFSARTIWSVPGDKLLRRSDEEAGSGVEDVCCGYMGIQRTGSFLTVASSRTTCLCIPIDEENRRSSRRSRMRGRTAPAGSRSELSGSHLEPGSRRRQQ